MGHSKAEDAGGLSPVKDGNEAAAHFNRRTLLFFYRFDYNVEMIVLTFANRKKHHFPLSRNSRVHIRPERLLEAGATERQRVEGKNFSRKTEKRVDKRDFCLVYFKLPITEDDRAA